MGLRQWDSDSWIASVVVSVGWCQWDSVSGTVAVSVHYAQHGCLYSFLHGDHPSITAQSITWQLLYNSAVYLHVILGGSTQTGGALGA